MPKRATKRGAQRTPLGNLAYDVLVCGASFAGLALARELRSTRTRVLVLDRYEIGERQTSACAAPTSWLQNLGLEDSIRQTFGSLLVHTPDVTARWPLPFTFSTFDYRTLCGLLWEQRGPECSFETATVSGRTGNVVHSDRGNVSAPLVVDALGWRRVLGAGPNVQPPNARLSRGLEVHPSGSGDDLELWIDREGIRAGYGWSFPARDEARVGVPPPATRCAWASARSTPTTTSRIRRCGWPRTSTATPCATRATGSRTGCARPSGAACSLWATAPATACR